MAYIYKIINDINDKIYIGKTLETIEKRWKQHCYDSKRDFVNRPLYKAMNKYGIEHFQIQMIEECDYTIVNEREKYWIKYYNSFKYGYNATQGGDGKTYIDRELVIQTYKEIQNQNQVAKILNISKDSVHNILQDNNIKILSNQIVNKNNTGKPVMALNIKTNNIIQNFDSLWDAGKWVSEILQKNGNISTIKSHISEAARGKRKTAYGFKWCFK